MENPDSRSKRTLRRSSHSHITMLDNDSTTSPPDSWHSPLRSDSPFRSDDPSFQPEDDAFVNKNRKSPVPADKFYSPGQSPGKPNVQASSPAARAKGWRLWPQSEKPTCGNADFQASPSAAGGKGGRREKPVSENHDKGTSTVVLGPKRLVRDKPIAGENKVGRVGGEGGGGLEEGHGGGEDEVGGERAAAVANILRRSERSVAMRKAAMTFRVFEMIACLISFSVMAADRTQGWSGDSFDRYTEYRGLLMTSGVVIIWYYFYEIHTRTRIILLDVFQCICYNKLLGCSPSNSFPRLRCCLAVNVIGFVYSGFQAYDVAYHLGTGKHVISRHLRCHFDFSMDQVMSYLLLSASSTAATRVTDWISNWGKDQFTLIASASIAMSFLAFIAFASSSLVSGYNLCSRDSS